MERCVWFELVDGDGRWISSALNVHLAPDARVADLRKAVKADNPSRLRTVDESDLQVFVDRVDFCQHQELHSEVRIGLLGGSSDDPLIVQVPKQLRWKPNEERESDLSNSRLHYVGRDAAVEQLCKVHQAVFIKATHGNQDQDDPWPIAFADNESGMGKTAFGMYYIQRCRENLPIECDADFRNSLCGCRKLRVVMPSHAFVEATSGRDPAGLPVAGALHKVINHAVAQAVQRELDLPRGFCNPELLLPPPGPDVSFVRAIVRSLGPVFIVLDSIYRGFHYDGDEAEELAPDLFLELCRTVLSDWMKTPGVYFVIIGDAPFLRNIEARNAERAQSRLVFVRLQFPLFSPADIEEIFCKTWVDSTKSMTLAHQWGLDSQLKIKEAALMLYYKTCGQPRRVAGLVCNYYNKNLDDLQRVQIDVFDWGTGKRTWQQARHQIRTWKSLLEAWLPSILDQRPVDLSRDWCCYVEEYHRPEHQRKCLLYCMILLQCDLGWAGTVKQATIYALPRILTVILHIVLPLRPYIRALHTHFRRVLLSATTILEWASLKRFQQLFESPCSPRAALPRFFGEETVFGQLDRVTISETVVDLPKIETGIIYCDRSHAHYLDYWPMLLGQINEKLDTSPTNSLCLKPLPESLGPAVILMQRFKGSKPGEKRLRQNEMVKTLTIGIVVASDRSMEFGRNDLLEECQQFVAMFADLDETTKQRFGKLTNVLIVCASSYSDEYAGTFQDKLFARQQSPVPGIDEVLLLDWTTPANRAEFFGLADEPPLAKLLDELVDKAG